jgi:hypothetical protein
MGGRRQRGGEAETVASTARILYFVDVRLGLFVVLGIGAGACVALFFRVWYGPHSLGQSFTFLCSSGFQLHFWMTMSATWIWWLSPMQYVNSSGLYRQNSKGDFRLSPQRKSEISWYLRELWKWRDISRFSCTQISSCRPQNLFSGSRYETIFLVSGGWLFRFPARKAVDRH